MFFDYRLGRGSLPLAPTACAFSATPSAGVTPATPPILSHGFGIANAIPRINYLQIFR